MSLNPTKALISFSNLVIFDLNLSTRWQPYFVSFWKTWLALMILNWTSVHCFHPKSANWFIYRLHSGYFLSILYQTFQMNPKFPLSFLLDSNEPLILAASWHISWYGLHLYIFWNQIIHLIWVTNSWDFWLICLCFHHITKNTSNCF